MSVRAALLDVLRARPGLRHAASRLVFSALPRRARFRLIWALDLWGGGQSRSGRASSLDATQALRAALPSLLAELGVRTLVDVPCGDFGWMQATHLGAVEYVGIDLVPEIVARNRARFEGAGRRFLVGDLMHDPLPACDAVLCRHLLPHLSFRDALLALDRIRESGARWLLSTTFGGVDRNYDVVTGDFRAIDLQRPPFSLPPPVRLLDDNPEGFRDNFLGVWDLRPPARAG